MQHDWIKSTLGHGETMCTRCFVTNREAAALGISNACDVPPPSPVAANSNSPVWPQDRIDEEVIDSDPEGEPEPGEDCGRWRNGALTKYCAKAGTEECDFECPLRDSECVRC